MNRLFTILSYFVVVFTLVTIAYAANGQGSGSQGSGQNNGLTDQGNSATQPIQNQNQVQTQNQGEEPQLRVNTQEQQGQKTGFGANSNSGTSGKKLGLNESRSMVGQQIGKLLGAGTAPGGVGEQVRQWARNQQQAEGSIQTHLSKIESKKGLLRTIFGPNYASLNALKQEVQQNRVRTQQLEQLKLKLTNQGDMTNVQEMITLMQSENTALMEKITAEERNGGWFGWLAKLFTI